MSSGGSSNSAASQSTNYYGTVACAFCWGPVGWLTAIIANGNFVWQCGSVPLDTTAPNSDGYIDLTAGVLDPTMFVGGGYLHFYPGVAWGNPDSAMAGHPADRDTCKLVAKGVFFGQDSGTPPSFQIIAGSCPRVPTTIVAAIDNVVDDRQVNPIACAAEYLLDERGGSLVEAQLDAPSWLAASHFWAQDQAHRDYAFVSPLFTEQVDNREIIKALLDPISCFLRWTPAGKLGCYIYQWGVDPGGLITLDARHGIQGKEWKFTGGTWEDLPTELVVSFTDRGFEFQDNTVSVPNQRAADARQTDDQRTLDRKHIMRSAQAFSHGVEAMRRMAFGTGTIYVRGPIVAGLQPGDKVKVDTDPEPGGGGTAQLVRIDKITTDRTDEVTMDVTVDQLLPATAYKPAWISPLPETLFAGATESAPSLAHLQALPLPPAAFDWPPAVAFVATRPSAQLTGFHAYFATNPANAFADLGSQVGFAARASLVSGVSAGAGTLRLQLTDGATGPDAYLAAQTPGGNLAEAQDNTLLAVLLALDGSGRVAIDGFGLPIMEFASIVQRSAITSDTHDYTVLRGACSLAARAWSAAALAWIVPKANLVPWRHELFASMLGSVGYFRLASFDGGGAIDESIPLPETDMVFPAGYIAQKPDQYTVLLSSEAHTVACDASGNVNSGQLGSGGTARTTVQVLRGATPLAAVSSGPVGDQFSIALGTLTNTGATKEANDTVRCDSLAADTGTIAITVNIGGAFTVTKVFTLTKSVKGTAGSNGANGTNGTNGINGTNGLNGLDGSKSFYSASTSVPSASAAGDTWFVTDLAFEMRRAAAAGTGSWVSALTGASVFEIIGGVTYIKKAAIRQVDAGVILAGAITAALSIGSGGSLSAGTGANRFYTDPNGTILGDPAGTNFQFTSNGGVTTLLLRSGGTTKASWTYTGGQITFDMGDPANSFIQNLAQLESQKVRALSSTDPRTTDAPLSTSGGAWIGASLDLRGRGYCANGLDVAGGVSFDGSNRISLRWVGAALQLWVDNLYQRDL
jgi:hypothetical protein